MTLTNRRKLKRYVVAPAMLAMLGYVAWFCYSRITYRPEPRIAYWEAKLREINPEMPGMVTFDEVIPVFKKAESWFNHTLGNPVFGIRKGDWTPSTRDDIAYAISMFNSREFQIAYAEHGELVRRGWVPPGFCRARVAPFSAHYARDWGYVLLSYSRFTFEEHRDVHERSKAWREMMITADLLESSKRENAILVAAAMRYDLAREISCALGETPVCQVIPKIDGLLATDVEIATTPSEMLAGAIVDERSEFDRIFVRDGGWLDVSAASTLYLDHLLAHYQVWNLVSPIYFDRDEADQALDRLVVRLNQCASAAQCRNEFNHRPDDLRDSAPLMLRPGYYHQYHGNLVRVLEATYRGLTANEGAACMIALHNYRAVCGEYPNDLHALVPDFLPRLPIDFAVREPLRYERQGGGVLLYSVGADGIDNHAQIPAKGIYSGSPWGPDGVDFVLSQLERGPLEK